MKRAELLNGVEVYNLVQERYAGKTQRDLAEELGVSVAYLNDYLHFRRLPGPKILEALGLRRVLMYERFVDAP